MKPLNARQLYAMIASGENVNVDFKESLFTKHSHVPRITQHHEIVKDLAAFANTDGGYLLVGVRDDGKVVGFNSNDHLEQRIINLCRDISAPPLNPSLYRVNVGEKQVLVIKIDRGNNHLHLVRGKVYIRVHNEVRVASGTEITDIVLKRNHDLIRELLQEKQSLAALIGKVSELSGELFKAKSLVVEMKSNDCCQGQVNLENLNEYNVHKVIKDCEKLLTNLDAVEMGNLSKYLVSANEDTDKLVLINELLELELDKFYCQFDKDEQKTEQ